MSKQSLVYRIATRCLVAADLIFHKLFDRSLFRHHFRRPVNSLGAVRAWTTGCPDDDADLVDRVSRAYRLSAIGFEIGGDSTWPTIFRHYHEDIHAAIMADRRAEIGEILRNPASSNLFYGIEGIARQLILHPRLEDRYSPDLTLDRMISLAEAVGTRRLEYADDFGRCIDATKVDIDEILDCLEGKFGFEIAIPNPFPMEYGVLSKRGVISARVPHAIYLAWRIADLVAGISNAKVLEIGAGVGRSALYCSQFGIKNYTIVDIPMTSFCQGYFLGRVLGPHKVVLYGEPESGAAERVHIVSPRQFLEGRERYDLIVNVDSLPEMDEPVARAYGSAIRERADAFLSINHESNDLSVREMIACGNWAGESTRNPYWLQDGYAEELFRFSPGRAAIRQAVQ